MAIDLLTKEDRGEQRTCLRKVRRSALLMQKGDPEALVDIAYGFFSTSVGGSQGRSAECFPYRPSQYIELLRKAADAGYLVAARTLTSHFMLGDVGPKDYVLAYFYFSLLAQEGNAADRDSGLDRLRYLDGIMSKSATEEAQGMFRKWQSEKLRQK